MGNQLGKSKRGIATSKTKSVKLAPDKAIVVTSSADLHSIQATHAKRGSSSSGKAQNLLPQASTAHPEIDARKNVSSEDGVEKPKSKPVDADVSNLQIKGLRQPNERLGRLLFNSSRKLKLFKDKVQIYCFQEGEVWRPIPKVIEPPLNYCSQDERRFRWILVEAIEPITQALKLIGVVGIDNREDMCEQDLKWLESEVRAKSPEWNGIVEDLLLCGRAIHMRSKIAMHKADHRGIPYIELPADMPVWAERTADKLRSIGFDVTLFTEVEDADGQFDSFSAKNLRTVYQALNKCGWNSLLSQIEYECRPMRGATIRAIYHALQGRLNSFAK